MELIHFTYRAYHFSKWFAVSSTFFFIIDIFSDVDKLTLLQGQSSWYIESGKTNLLTVKPVGTRVHHSKQADQLWYLAVTLQSSCKVPIKFFNAIMENDCSWQPETNIYFLHLHIFWTYQSRSYQTVETCIPLFQVCNYAISLKPIRRSKFLVINWRNHFFTEGH